MSFITLSRSALINNLNEIGKYVEIRKVAAVLKDNAYGHGLEEMATMLSENGVEWAVVRNIYEANRIQKIIKNIIILAQLPIEKSSYHYAVNSLEDLSKIPVNTNIQLKIDSGMHRNGIDPKELEEVLDLIEKKSLNLTGVFSHLKASDELSSELYYQEKIFLEVKGKVVNYCKEKSKALPLFHLYNSAAVLRNKNAENYDLVRTGIALYGYNPMPEIFGDFNLKPVLTLWAERIATRGLDSGSKIGYSGAFVSKENMTVSTYDVGYADGFFRLDGSEKYITSCGKEIVGKVSMDNMSIASEEEQICLIDNANILAKIKNTICYEVLVRLNPNIKRKIID